VTDYFQLPANARRYLEAVEAMVQCPITLISTGPDRIENIVLKDPWS
jgi:adenylosuccinate synthase